MSYFELFFWSFLGVVATDIFLKAYPLKAYPKMPPRQIWMVSR